MNLSGQAVGGSAAPRRRLCGPQGNDLYHRAIGQRRFSPAAPGSGPPAWT
jgi:hypothetical protein